MSELLEEQQNRLGIEFPKILRVIFGEEIQVNFGLVRQMVDEICLEQSSENQREFFEREITKVIEEQFAKICTGN